MARARCALALFSSFVSAPAQADEVSGLRSELLTERSHAVALTMRANHAELVVRRTVHNGADKSDQATFFIELRAGPYA